jgi:hypothetical protein
VYDLSAICLGLVTAKLNFPVSEYESGGCWAEEAREAACVDRDELTRIWSRCAKQRTLDGMLITPGCNVCRL